jgi:hypothetical protein
MRVEARIIAILALGVSLAGCKAEVGTPDDLGDDAGDLSVSDDGDAGDDGGDAGSCPVLSYEICNNNCDDDRNGYTDADDWQCTTQFIATLQPGSTSLSRLILEPMPQLQAFDGNPVSAGGMALLDRNLASNVVFLVFTGGNVIERLTLSSSGPGMISSFTPTPKYPTRDVCRFNGELVVVERNVPSVLHRYMPDGQTQISTVSLGSVLATSCASDGNLLYVAVHDTALSPTTFQAYDSSYLQQAAAIPLPAGIASYGGGLDRCLDFAWSQRSGFWGLFVQSSTALPSNPLNDNQMSGGLLFPFAFDGGSGAPVDAGMLYGVGGFAP